MTRQSVVSGVPPNSVLHYLLAGITGCFYTTGYSESSAVQDQNKGREEEPSLEAGKIPSHGGAAEVEREVPF